MNENVVIPVFALLGPVFYMAGPLIMIIAVIYFGLRYAREKREFLSRERLAAIEKGLDMPLLDSPKPRTPRSPLRWAIITIAVGIGLALFLAMLPGEAGISWGIGVLIALVGVAMLVHWFLGGRQEWQRSLELDEELRRAYIERLRAGGTASKPNTSAG